MLQVPVTRALADQIPYLDVTTGLSSDHEAPAIGREEGKRQTAAMHGRNCAHYTFSSSGEKNLDFI